MSSETEHQDLLLGNQLCFKLYTASHLIIKSYTPLLTRLGLTYTQYLVMLVLWEHDELPVNDVAKRLMLQTNTVTPLLKRMEVMGLIKKEKGTADARKAIVSLTDKGREMENTACDIPNELKSKLACDEDQNEPVAGLSDRLDSLIEILKKLA